MSQVGVWKKDNSGGQNMPRLVLKHAYVHAQLLSYV